MMTHDRHGLAFVAGKQSFHLAALALDAALAGSPGVRRVIFVGISLEEGSFCTIRDIAARHDVHLEDHSLDLPVMGAGSDGLSLSMLSHLLSRARGLDRVLYLCPGAMVRGDLSPLLSLDLRGKVLAGVRDAGKLKLGYDFVRGKSGWDEVEGIARLINPWPIQSYIDTGVLLIDCAAIRDDAFLLNQIADPGAAGVRFHDDQDRINLLFKGRILHVNPAWNAPWGHLPSRLSWTRRCGYRGEETAFRMARITRFDEVVHPKDTSSFMPKICDRMEKIAYRMALRSFRLRHPDLDTSPLLRLP